jgi:hypothetical protein
MELPWNSATRASTPSLLEPDESEAFLRSVYLPLRHWQELERTACSVSWGNASNQFRTLELIAGSGGFPAINQTSLNDYRRVTRQNALEQGHGIVAVELSNVNDFVALTTITKYPLEHQLGFGYNGWICVPLPTCTLNLYSTVHEHSMTEQRMTEQRETAISGLIAQDFSANSDLNTCTRDPYDPEFDEVALYHPTDEANFDHLFPNHPLSLIRKDLRILELHTVFCKPSANERKT